MRSASRNRALTLAAVVAFLVVTGRLFPDPAERVEWQYLFVISLGYGHLLGAAVFGRERMRRFAPAGVSPLLFGAFVATSVATLFAAYLWTVALHPDFFVPLLAISVWHTVENDVAIARSYAVGGTLAPFGRGLRTHARVALVSAALLVVGAALLRPADYGLASDGTLFAATGEAIRALSGRDSIGGAWFGFGDLFSAVTLYHLIGFLLHFADRARAMAASGRSSAALWRRLAWVHLPPLAICALLIAVPDARADSLRLLLFSPVVYLFWSVLHVAQTALARGLAPPARRHAPVRV